MEEFSNIDDLANFIASSFGFSNVMGTGDIKIALHEAGELLKDCIQIYIDDFYLSYKPVEYIRTYDFQKSLRVSPVTTDGFTYSIEVYFDERQATHPSIFNGGDGYLPFLLNDGWQWHNDKTFIYRLSYYDGFNFVEKGIDRFNTMNKWGFNILVVRNEI
jgi:hypothetical protein